MVAEVELKRPQRIAFRSSTAPDESPEMRRVVALAVARAKEGDQEALRFLYVRYTRNVQGYVASILHDEHEAEDVTQHVFAKLMTVLVKYDQRETPFFGWLLRLAHNAAIDHLRSRRASPVEEVFGADERWGDERVEELSRSLSLALATLPREQRDVVLMRHMLGLSPGEIAERMGRSESSVHGLHHRGRRALRAELERLKAGPSVAIHRSAA
jgi:RNA polymerase sigma-70 factor (ECF subfamily)